MRTEPTQSRGRRVGLDKPCSRCGRPVYYNYQGPVEGVCGRCADGTKRKRRTRRSRGAMVVQRRGRAVPRALTALLVIACIAAAFVLLRHFLPGFPG